MSTPGNTTQRGYGYTHQQQRRQWARTMARQGGAECARCGGWIDPDQPWDLGHHDWDRTVYVGPEHRLCNRRAGGLSARGKLEQPLPRSREW
jgi:hypothetical protein